jgi:hypothetical protein
MCNVQTTLLKIMKNGDNAASPQARKPTGPKPRVAALSLISSSISSNLWAGPEKKHRFVLKISTSGFLLYNLF